MYRDIAEIPKQERPAVSHPDNLPTPSLLRRLVAMLYDSLLVIPLIMAGTALVLGIGQLLSLDRESLAPAWAVQGIAVVGCSGFFVLFWMKSGQTLGMQAWRIKLVAAQGRKLTVGRLLMRCAAALLSAACLGLGYLWCLVDREGLGWHDRLTGTRLVLLPKAARTKGSGAA
jgi:uncharacterized RDD family membrane protein YckC